jgi:type I restriction enzyme S subunit
MIKLQKDKWNKIALNKCCEFHRGVTYSTNDEVDTDGIGILRANNINAENSKLNFENLRLIRKDAKVKEAQKLRKYDVLICTASGSLEHIGKVAFAKEDTQYYAGGFMGIVRPIKKEIEPNLLFNIFLSENFTSFIQNQRAGTNIQNLKFSNLEGFEIPLPPLEEQKQIAALFQSIETAMEQVDGQEKNLLQLKNKLLSDLFSDKKEFGNHLRVKDFETIRFDKIAINISERVEPKKTELPTYVGLEHLDADNLVIERTGTPDNVIGTKLKIYKGDIIFGKRRAYLRKVAISHFDGIASAHSMILRANEKHIEKGFLPFFMQSDAFMSRAVQISEGSLSPTIKVKTLAKQEFTLPKKEKQKELVALFKQFDETRQQLKQQKVTLKWLKQKLLNEILG